MQLKANVIICDNCHCKLDKESIVIKRKIINVEAKGIDVAYFKCTHCGKPYITEVVKKDNGIVINCKSPTTDKEIICFEHFKGCELFVEVVK